MDLIQSFFDRHAVGNHTSLVIDSYDGYVLTAVEFEKRDHAASFNSIPNTRMVVDPEVVCIDTITEIGINADHIHIPDDTNFSDVWNCRVKHPNGINFWLECHVNINCFFAFFKSKNDAKKCCRFYVD